jgi:hypothetical protein
MSEALLGTLVTSADAEQMIREDSPSVQGAEIGDVDVYSSSCPTSLTLNTNYLAPLTSNSKWRESRGD